MSLEEKVCSEAWEELLDNSCMYQHDGFSKERSVGSS